MTHCGRSEKSRIGRTGVSVVMLAALIAAASACTPDTEERLTGPDTPSATVTAGSPMVSIHAIDAIDDAITRLIPSLSDPAAAGPVGTALNGIRKQLADGDAATLRGAIEAARKLIDVYEQRTGQASGDDADVQAVRLALESVTS